MIYYIASIYETKLDDPVAAKKYYTRYLALAKPANANEVKAFKYVRERSGKTNTRDTALLKNRESKEKDEELSVLSIQLSFMPWDKKSFILTPVGLLPASFITYTR